MTRGQLKHKFDLYAKLMRLDKPIGILLLLWPTLWALWIAGNGRPNWAAVWIFTLGAVLMRSAGCVMNDYADRHFDPHVERTKHRPLAAGQVSAGEALGLAALLCLGAFILVLFLNRLTLILSFAALFLAATYPYTKRFLSVPQAYLGIAFGFGVPMAFAALTGRVPAIAWLLLLANVFWAVAYDTEYAMVDRDDDISIGIRSSALFFGRFDIAAVMACYALMLMVLGIVGVALALGWPFYAGLGVAAGLMLYHFTLIRGRDRMRCFKAFLHNNWVGAAIFAGIVASYALK
ncbi:MAG: 4-hydroxybenzoate octaprenyltransferase [Nitrosomonadales bacterium]|nr:MAG: 4-hydroxybenzoate octaprenyltransferase [Nitrosomonadales bacterium]